MTKRVIWEGRTSPLLYIYECIGTVAIAYLAQAYFHVHLLAYALAIVFFICIAARSMRYVVSESDIYFSPSMIDSEATTVNLTDILAIHVIDRQPWAFFNLGTLIFVTDHNAEMQPCMKCVSDPKRLANSIQRRAQILGSPHIQIHVS